MKKKLSGDVECPEQFSVTSSSLVYEARYILSRRRVLFVPLLLVVACRCRCRGENGEANKKIKCVMWVRERETRP